MKPIRWKEGQYNSHFAYVGRVPVATMCWAVTKGGKDWSLSINLPIREKEVRVSGKEEAEKIIAHHVGRLIAELTEE